MQRNAPNDASAMDGLKLLLRAFAGVPGNWFVLARNFVPVVGVYAFAWSAAQTVLSYWWDGVSLLALLVAAVVVRVSMDESKKTGVVKRWLQGIVGWIVVFGMFGIPYWMAFGALEMGSAADEVMQDVGRSAAFGAIAIGNAFSGLHKGFLTLEDSEVKRRAQAGLHTLVTRAILMMLMWHWGLASLLVPFMALVLTGTEVWPGVLAEVARINKADRYGVRDR